MAIPPSKTISWAQTIQEADQDWIRKYQRPVVYEFSNGRTFVWNPATYVTPGP